LSSGRGGLDTYQNASQRFRAGLETTVEGHEVLVELERLLEPSVSLVYDVALEEQLGGVEQQGKTAMLVVNRWAK